MKQGLERTGVPPSLSALNRLPEAEARARFLDCCGSLAWARRMVEARPFKDAHELLAAADRIWADLGPDDWRAAFRAHPRIGDRPQASAAGERATAARWSAQEQSRVGEAPDSVALRLREANDAYEARFGHLFIVCATGKEAGELLKILTDRLSNDPETELTIAAEEQLKITRLRLGKLLGS